MCVFIALIFCTVHYTVMRMGDERRQDRENQIRWTPSPSPQRSSGVLAAAERIEASTASSTTDLESKTQDQTQPAGPAVADVKVAPSVDAKVGLGLAHDPVEGVHAMVSSEGGDIEVVYQVFASAL